VLKAASVLLFLMMLFTSAGTSTAYAHAALATSAPASGSVVSAANEVVLTFTEPVSPTSMRLVTPAGDTLEVQAAAEDRRITVQLPELMEGTHLLSWRTISLDGHPISGTVIFSVGVETAITELTEPTDQSLRIATWITRTLLYVGLFVGVGGAFFATWIASGARPQPGATTLRGALVLAAASSALALGLQGADMLGEPAAALVFFDTWRMAAMSTYGMTVAAIWVALLLATGALITGRPTARILGALAMLSGAGAFALSGHASRALPELGSWALVTVHTASVLFWVGALVPLFVLLRRVEPDTLPALNRFSTAIPWSIAPLVLSGAALTLIQLTEPADLWRTDYGRVLAIKLGLVALLFGLAVVNRFWLTPRAQTDPVHAPRRLAQLIVVEILLVFAVFAVVALWRFTPPPRTMENAAAAIAMQPTEQTAPFQSQLVSGDITADIILTRTGVGSDLVIGIVGASPLEVAVEVADPQAGISATRKDAVLDENGRWIVQDLPVVPTPTATIAVQLLITDFDQMVLRGALGPSEPASVPMDHSTHVMR
jgi:copper transport protein